MEIQVAHCVNFGWFFIFPAETRSDEAYFSTKTSPFQSLYRSSESPIRDNINSLANFCRKKRALIFILFNSTAIILTY